MDQLAPSHLSIKAPVADAPTATQVPSDVHDTPSSPLELSGVGVAISDQSEPFHNIDAACCDPLTELTPTATQLRVLLHDKLE